MRRVGTCTASSRELPMGLFCDILMPEGGAVESNHMAPAKKRPLIPVARRERTEISFQYVGDSCVRGNERRKRTPKYHRHCRASDPGLPGCAAYTAAYRVMTYFLRDLFVFVVIARRQPGQSRAVCVRRQREGWAQNLDEPHAPSVCGPGYPTPPPNHPLGYRVRVVGRGSGWPGAPLRGIT